MNIIDFFIGTKCAECGQRSRAGHQVEQTGGKARVLCPRCHAARVEAIEREEEKRKEELRRRNEAAREEQRKRDEAAQEEQRKRERAEQRARDRAPKVCAVCAKAAGQGMGGILDRCDRCGKLVHRSCKQRVSYQQHCPFCNGISWSTT